MIEQHRFDSDDELFSGEGAKAALGMTTEWAQGFTDALHYSDQQYENPQVGEDLELTEVQIKLLLNCREIFHSHLERIGDAYAKMTGQDGTGGEPEFNGDDIEWSWSRPCGRGCCSDSMYTKMPTRMLWTPREQWAEDICVQKQREAEEKARKEAVRRAAEEAERVKRQEQRDRDEYKRLQAKFEK